MKQKKGFTLIELLVVIAIIGILSAIGLVALNGAREKARDAKRKSDLSSIATALAMFYDDQTPSPKYVGQYQAAGSWTYVIADVDASLTASLVATASATKYMAALPQPPKAGDPNEYYYVSSVGTAFARFALVTQLEGLNKDWYIVNSVGYSGTHSSTTAFTTGMECAETDSGAPLSICLTTPT